MNKIQNLINILEKNLLSNKDHLYDLSKHSTKNDLSSTEKDFHKAIIFLKSFDDLLFENILYHRIKEDS